MRASTAALLLAILCVDAAFGFYTVSQMRAKHNRRQAMFAKHNYKRVPEQYFEQKLDHFLLQDTRTWKQRYYIDTGYWNGQGPIFFQVGGEGAISDADIELLQMNNYGHTYGALLVALEHRFYGASQPFNGDVSTASLNYLTSQQALADAANFIHWIQEQYNATNSPVITFGCSYPGNLAAWFRLKYPTITAGAVASSAPVQATADMYSYLEVVDRSLANFTGPKCDQLIQQATNQIEQMLQTSTGQKQVANMFKTCGPLGGTKDISTLMSNLMGNWMGTVQYNDENENPIDINYLCGIMNSADSALDGYVKVNNVMLQAQGQNCQDVSYEDMVMEMNATVVGNDGGVGIRQWVYQTCFEFGYFQTTDAEDQPFGNLVPLKFYTDLCKDVYGLDFIPSRIDDTNTYYGGHAIPANGPTNILFVNGEIDPWHSLGVTWDISPTLLHILISDTAHCANVLPNDSADPADLVVARQLTSKIIGTWLH
jgi:hypothetical protein